MAAEPTSSAPAAVGYGTSKGAAFQDTLAKVQDIVDDGKQWADLGSSMEAVTQLLELLDNIQKLQPANVPVDAMVPKSAV